MFEHVVKAREVKQRYTFHLLGLVHLPISRDYMGCAFTQKIYKMSKMLMSLGHTVYVYGAEGSVVPCTEFVQTHTLDDIRDAWGDGDNRFEIGYNWKDEGFRHDFNSQRAAATIKYYRVASDAIKERMKPDDFLLLMQGSYQKPIADNVKLWLTCEPGIGYRGSYAKFRAFESSYLQNFTYGSEHPRQSINGNHYDRVIPNYFEAEDFPFRKDKADYLLFIGRLIQRKGIGIACQVADITKTRLIVAGQGEFNYESPNVTFIGYAEPDVRAQLMSSASAILVPTLYLEAFGGVNVEAQLCGTPAITTNFGVFPETVVNGITGYRCDTLQDFVVAAKEATRLDPHIIREHAERYLVTNVRWEFQKWFDDLHQLYLSAHNTNTRGWHHIDGDSIQLPTA